MSDLSAKRSSALCLLAMLAIGLAACSGGRVAGDIAGETVVTADRRGTVAVLRNPTRGGLLTSPFGYRRHPISGKVKRHRGIDLAAPIGTAVVAASDGTLYFRGDRGSFGNLIKVQHSDHVVTAYAHLSRFEPGLTAGRRVRKGQVIGYVGTTGRSSGPHLHYEVLLDGQQIDPLGPGGTKIANDPGAGMVQAALGFGNLARRVGRSFQGGTPSAHGLVE